MVFEKLYKFIGKDIKSLIDRPDGLYCFRLQKNRVFYVSEKIMRKATNVSSATYMLFCSVNVAC
jgi:60S ribosome subunit biogenesis protein NIP7